MPSCAFTASTNGLTAMLKILDWSDVKNASLSVIGSAIAAHGDSANESRAHCASSLNIEFSDRFDDERVYCGEPLFPPQALRRLSTPDLQMGRRGPKRADIAYRGLARVNATRIAPSRQNCPRCHT